MPFEKGQEILDGAVSKGLVRGAGVCAGHAGEIVCEFSAGLASEDTADKMKSFTLFDLGSMTGPLATSTVWMALASHNEINLNTPACKFWPDFSEEGKEKVTLRHLLKHTSGFAADIPYYRDLIAAHGDRACTSRGAEFIYGRIASEGLEYPPTYMVIRSNPGLMALGHIAEIIAGAPIDGVFERTVASPMHLEDTFYRVPATRTGACAATFFCPERKRLIRGEVFDANAWAMGGVAGHAGLFSTAADSVRIAMGLARSLKKDGGIWHSGTVDEFIGPKAKYKLGWETPVFDRRQCGRFFSRNTVGFIGNTCVSLWVDLDSQNAIAVFASPSGRDIHDPARAQGDFESFLPAIHDSLMEEMVKAG